MNDENEVNSQISRSEAGANPKQRDDGAATPQSQRGNPEQQ